MDYMENRPHFKQGAIKYTKGYGVKLFVSKITKITIMLIAIIISIISVYIYIKQPIRTEKSFIFATPQYKILNIGDKVIVVKDKNHNLFTPLKRAMFVHEISEAEVIAGPYGKITPTDKTNEYLINYQELNTVAYLDNPEEYLEMKYIVRFLNNNNENSVLDKIVSKDEILGLKIEK